MVSYAIAAIGFALIGWAVVRMSPANVNLKLGNHLLKKLFAANNHARARKFCRIEPNSYFGAVGAAIDAAEASGSKDPATLTSLATPAFEAKATTLVDAWRKLTELALIGVLLVFGGAALAVSAGPMPTAHLVTSGVALLAGAWFAFRRSNMTTSIESARREILPALVASIAGGDPAAEKKTDETGPFRTIGIPKRARKGAIASLRDQVCPMCGPTTTRSIDRDGGAFTVLVCTGCGYAQEFADLAKLTP